MAHASYTDVTRRIPYRNITTATTTGVTTAIITQWITEAEARLDNALSAQKITAPTDGNGNEILKNVSAEYVAGLVKQAYASTAGDGTNDDGRLQIDEFREVLADIRINAEQWNRELNGATTTNAKQVRGYVLDNADSKTISDGDFTPTFTRDTKF